MKSDNYKDFDCFIEYLDNPDFAGAVVAKESRYFYGSDNLFDKSVQVFERQGLGFTVNKLARRLVFNSGATLIFTVPEAIGGWKFNAALVLDTDTLSFEDVMRVKSRIRVPCSHDGSLWFYKQES